VRAPGRLQAGSRVRVKITAADTHDLSGELALDQGP